MSTPNANDPTPPAFLQTGSGEEETLSRLAAGAELGPHRIEAELGAGGMGHVYKARDTRLGRFVAIKVSKEKFSDRFEREARTISALNHSHICTPFDVAPTTW